jgi:hypothetical protein
MPHEFPVRSGWQEQVVATRTRLGQVYLLLDVRKTPCPNCGYGVHVETTWGSTTGDANRLTWCSSCFNAHCEGAELSEGQQHLWQSLVQGLPERLDYWAGARPAIEELERRGLV